MGLCLSISLWEFFQGPNGTKGGEYLSVLHLLHLEMFDGTIHAQGPNAQFITEKGQCRLYISWGFKLLLALELNPRLLTETGASLISTTGNVSRLPEPLSISMCRGLVGDPIILCSEG